MKKNEAPIVIEQCFDCHTGTVWDALTRPEQMRKWFFENIPEFEAVVGFETCFDVQAESQVFPHVWRVTEVIPGKKVSIDWSYKGYPGRALVRFELFGEEGRTRLKLTNQVIEDFPDNIPEFTRQSCLQGWTWLISESLTNYLQNGFLQLPLP